MKWVVVPGRNVSASAVPWLLSRCFSAVIGKGIPAKTIDISEASADWIGETAQNSGILWRSAVCCKSAASAAKTSARFRMASRAAGYALLHPPYGSGRLGLQSRHWQSGCKRR
jgi:hypothetical protein